MTIKKCDRCKQEAKNIETCMLPDFSKNGGIIGSYIYGRPFKYVDL